MLILISGFKNYVRFQWVMWYVVLLAFAVMFAVLFFTPASEFVQRLNAFSAASGGSPNFYQVAVDAVKAAGIDLKTPLQPDSYHPGRSHRLDLPAVGYLLCPAEW